MKTLLEELTAQVVSQDSEQLTRSLPAGTLVLSLQSSYKQPLARTLKQHKSGHVTVKVGGAQKFELALLVFLWYGSALLKVVDPPLELATSSCSRLCVKQDYLVGQF